MKRLFALFSLFAVCVSAQIMMGPSARLDVMTSGTTPIASPWHTAGGTYFVQLDDDVASAYLHWSRDYLGDGDFEDDPRSSQGAGGTSNIGSAVSPWSEDLWDDGTLTGRWSQTEGAGGSIEVTSTQLFGEESLLYDASGGTAVAQMGTNMNLDTFSGGFTGWTEDVNAGSGTVTEGTTLEHTNAGSEAILTGGSAHVDFELAITVVASTEYFVSFWMREGDASDLCDFRVQESTGGTDWLQADGTWDTGEVDFITSDGTSYAHHLAVFTTDASITAVRISFSADVSGDVCGIDDIGMALVPATLIQTSTLFQVTETVTDSYVVGVYHADGGTDSILQISLQDAATCTGDNTCLYWDGSSDWTTTETWVSCANVGTTSTVCEEPFLAHDAALTSDHRVIVKARALMGTAEDVTLDNFYVVEAAIVGRKGVGFLAANQINSQPLTFDVPQVRGRFSTIASGAIGVAIFGTMYGGE